MTAPEPPPYLHAHPDGDFLIYVHAPGHDHDEAWAVDDPELLEIEDVWMRHVPPPPIEERFDSEPLCQRDKRGRFSRVWWWEECSASHPDAQPYLGLRYKP